MTPTAGPPARPALDRRTWHVRANAVVVAWLVAAVVVAVVHRWLPESGWLLTHLTLLGAVASAILIWSAHFADTLLGRPAPGGQRFMVVRLAAHNLGALGVVGGLLTARDALTTAGAVLVAVNALVHGAVIVRQRRGAIMARFGALSRFYLAAAAALATGAVLGAVLARSTADAATHAERYLAHVGVMLLGFVGITVLGTLVVLWPTMLRTKMVEGAPAAAGRALWLLVGGVALVGGGALAGTGAVVLAGSVAYLAGIALLVRPMVAIAVPKPPTSFATLSAAAAVGWLAVSVGTFGVLAVTAADLTAAVEGLGAVVPLLAVGLAAQVLLGALSYLAPVMLGGGPSVVRAVNEEMDRAAVARVVVVNACLALFVLPVPSLVRVTTSMLGLAALASFLVLLGRAVLARRAAARRDDGDLLASGLRVGPPPVRRRLGGAWGAAAVALAVVLGVAGDPAAAGLASGSAAAGADATGRTTTVQVRVEGMRFVPAVVEVPAGDELVIELTNTGEDVHDLVLETGAATGRLGVGETARLEVGVVGADVEGWCSVAGHRQMGMTLDVVAIGAAPSGEGDDTAAAGTDAGSHGQHGGTPGGPSAAEQLDLMATPAEGFEAHDPVLPPAPDATVHEVTLEVSEVRTEVAPGVVQERWTFGGTAPGPTLRGKVGDVFDIILVNDGTIGHSIDFHAGALAPDRPMRTIAPGESLTYRFTATRSGIWMYHCSTMPMSMHIANGMFGAVVIDPPDLEPVDREYILVQSEVYLGAVDGPADAGKIAAEAPDLVVFNGYANQYDHDRPVARVGERVRLWVLDAGPSRGSAFHVVGGQFDTVYSEGSYLLGGPSEAGGDPTGGAQVLPLVAAQGGFVELAFPEAGSYPFVSHAMVDAERGAHGHIEVGP